MPDSIDFVHSGPRVPFTDISNHLAGLPVASGDITYGVWMTGSE